MYVPGPDPAVNVSVSALPSAKPANRYRFPPIAWTSGMPAITCWTPTTSVVLNGPVSHWPSIA